MKAPSGAPSVMTAVKPRDFVTVHPLSRKKVGIQVMKPWVMRLLTMLMTIPSPPSVRSWPWNKAESGTLGGAIGVLTAGTGATLRSVDLFLDAAGDGLGLGVAALRFKPPGRFRHVFRSSQTIPAPIPAMANIQRQPR